MAVSVKIPHEAKTAKGVLPKAQMTVNVYGGGAATVYNDRARAGTLTQPIYSNPDGTFPGFVVPGRYSVVISYGADSETHEWNALGAGIEAWTTATGFTNSWVNYFFSTRYRKTSEGLVVIEGVIAGGTLSATAFQLPVGYRPGATIVAAADSNALIGRVDITTGGDVIPRAPSTNDYVRFPPLTFMAEN